MEPINRSVIPLQTPVVEAINGSSEWVLLEPGNEIVNEGVLNSSRPPFKTYTGNLNEPPKVSLDNFYIPNDIMRIIFTYARGDILALQRVNKKWRQLANDGQLYKMMIAASAIDKKCWEKYIGDPGTEPKYPDLPLVIFKEIEKGEGSLTLIPKTVKVKRMKEVNEEGVIVSKEIIEEVSINPQTMGELVTNRKEGGQETHYHSRACREAIEEKRDEEESHWVYIRQEPVGRNATFQKQQEIARAQNHRKVLDASSQNEVLEKSSQIIKERADVAGLNDLIVTVFMEKIRSGKSYFELKAPGQELTWRRVNEQTQGRRVMVAFKPPAICVLNDFSDTGPFFAVAVARKSFGH